MHLNPAILRHPSVLTRSIPRNSNPALRGPVGSPQASAEIHAFIAARDMALAEAERNPADMTLNRAFLANQLVQNCLQPPRSPYQAQALPEAEAIRERQRCNAAQTRIAHLRTGLANATFECAVAA